MSTATPLGIKRTCPSCSVRFYDLNHTPAECPKCNHRFDPNQQFRPRRARRAAPEESATQEDALIKHMNKTKSAVKPRKEEKAMDGLEELGAPGGGLEALEEIDDIEALEEIEVESPDEEEMDDDIVLDEDVVGDEALIDAVEEESEEEELTEEEDEEKSSKKAKKRK